MQVVEIHPQVRGGGCLLYMAYIMSAHGMALQGARASAHMVLILFARKIPFASRMGLILYMLKRHIDGLMQNCCISRALAMEILQTCAKPSISVFVIKNSCLTVIVKIIPRYLHAQSHGQESYLLMTWCSTEPSLCNDITWASWQLQSL